MEVHGQKGPIKIWVLGKSGSGGMKKEEEGDKWVGCCKIKDKMGGCLLKESNRRKECGNLEGTSLKKKLNNHVGLYSLFSSVKYL